ncbi:MAG: hypothetical protein J5747_12555 [Spirochaetaceae bacterium]|nr:hypothetical protein [Spirochaetaceae bacterium]MBO4706058.1 hypothetical protein [Spirochaetaceae bacterium]
MTIEAYKNTGTSFMLTREQFAFLNAQVLLHLSAFKSEVTTDIGILFRSGSQSTPIALPEKML